MSSKPSRYTDKPTHRTRETVQRSTKKTQPHQRDHPLIYPIDQSINQPFIYSKISTCHFRSFEKRQRTQTLDYCTVFLVAQRDGPFCHQFSTTGGVSEQQSKAIAIPLTHSKRDDDDGIKAGIGSYYTHQSWNWNKQKNCIQEYSKLLRTPKPKKEERNTDDAPSFPSFRRIRSTTLILGLF